MRYVKSRPAAPKLVGDAHDIFPVGGGNEMQVAVGKILAVVVLRQLPAGGVK